MRSFDTATMSPDSAAALFWAVRNGLFFSLGLDRRDDVLLLSYDDLVADPEATMRRLCAFIGFPYRPQLCAHVERRTSHGSRRLDIDPRVRELCDRMGDRLAAVMREQGSATGPTASSTTAPSTTAGSTTAGEDHR